MDPFTMNDEELAEYEREYTAWLKATANDQPPADQPEPDWVVELEVREMIERPF